MVESIEKPILFSGPMVRAILEGRKTQTRRVMKPQPSMHFLPEVGLHHPTLVDRRTGQQYPGPERFGAYDDGETYPCPHPVGSLMWVRETWWQAGDWYQSYPEDDEYSRWGGSKRVVYAADGLPPNEPNRHYPEGLCNGAYSAADPNAIWRKRPSIHMEKCFARIWLEVTDVRVERLQSITEEDSISEGIHAFAGDLGLFGYDPSGTPGPMVGSSAIEAFSHLWRSINGPDSWDANPWVWVYRFERWGPSF